MVETNLKFLRCVRTTQAIPTTRIRGCTDIKEDKTVVVELTARLLTIYRRVVRGNTTSEEMLRCHSGKTMTYLIHNAPLASGIHLCAFPVQGHKNLNFPELE